jgi:plastocyanin
MKRLGIFVIIVAFTACSSDGPTHPGGGGGGGGGGGNNPPPTQRTVAISGVSFSPSTATVAVGGTVTWTGDGGVAHDITPGANNSAWSATTVPAGATGTVLQASFPTAGSYAYSCTIHSGMTGTIVVS